MAKYFLGSVGTAEAFKLDGSELVLAFVSKTLTDSGINISTTKDDIRAGTGAPIVASFYHDPSVEITLTDVMFKTEYVEAQLGADFYANGESYQSEAMTESAATFTLRKDPVEIALGCGNESYKVLWYTEAGKDEWKILKLTASTLTGKTVTFPVAGKYCVRYLAKDEAARVATIKSDMIPQELFLIITAPIYAGDACSASNGRQAGEIQFEVPRFKLNGAQDFTMAMSSNQTLSLSGSALAYTDSCDITGSKLLRIIEVIWNRKWYESAQSLIFDADYLSNGETVEVYAVYANGTTSLIDNSVLTLSVTGATNAISAAGALTVNEAGTVTASFIKDGANLTVTADLDYEG